MSDSTRVIKPAAEDLPTDLVELVQAISQLDGEVRNRLEPLVGRVVESTKRRRRRAIRLRATRSRRAARPAQPTRSRTQRGNRQV